jgi:hypothetical protein
MRRSFLRCCLVLLFLSSMVVPASAAPRRDDGPLDPTRFVERFVEIAKHAISALDDVKGLIPIP